MKQSHKLPLLTLSLMMGAALTGCGGRTPGSVVPDVTPTPAPATGVTDPSYTAPTSSYPTDTYTPPVTTQPVATNPVASVPMTPAGSFKIDQGNIVYGWRVRGIAVSSGTIYAAVVDRDGLTKNGTVIKMDAMAGKNWTDLGTSLFGLSSKLNSTLEGVAIAGGNLFAIDSAGGLYSVRTSGGEVKELKGSGGTDIAGSNYGIFVASHSTLERGDMTGQSRTPMPAIVTSAGIGADSRGNVFFINGNRVGVLPMNGMPQDVILQGLTQPIDVAANALTGEILVLDGGTVKRFSSSGQLISSFQHGATQPTSIAVDETGSVYVADYGTSSSDSKVLKFTSGNGQAINGGMAGYPQTGAYPQTGYGQTYPQTGYGQTYPQTGYGQTYPQTGYGQTYPQTGYGQTYPQTGYGQTYPQTGYTGYAAGAAQPQQQQAVYGAYSQPQQARQY